jgi:hypothetical protein
MRPARVVTWILIVLGAAAAVLAFLGLFRAGVGWDAPIDVHSAIEVRTLPPGLSLQDAYLAVYSTSEYYGILVAQIADAVHQLASASQELLPPDRLETYRWYGAVSIVIAVLGAACLGVAVASALRSALAGAFAWAATMTTPLYLGMSYIDAKDVPVAAGLTMLSSGLILSRSLGSDRGRYAAGIALATGGAAIALGQRPGSWPLITLLSVGSITVFAIADLKVRRPRRLLPPLASVVVAGVGAVAFLWLTNPLARIDLPRWLFDAFTVMRSYAWTSTVLTNGTDLPATDLPWWYVPAWLLAQLPVLTTVALLLAGGCAVAAVIGATWSLGRPAILRLVPLAVQGLLLPAGIVVAGSVIYDGLRHVLFMIPALVGLVSIGIATLERHGSERPGSEQWAGRAIAASIAALLVVAAGGWANVRWFPYSYAFINPIAGRDADRQNWELDFWGVTAIEGVERMEAEGLSPVAVLPTQITSGMVGAVGPDVASEQSPDGHGLYVFHRLGAELGDCQPIFAITRDRQVLGEGGRCP